MATYEESGVNIDLGDRCSAVAYSAAKATFSGRKGMMGEPVVDDGGFSGLLDMGAYYLVQNDDGVGTKILIAEMIDKYDTLGYDLIAMVADDAVCVGAETISVSNTLDVDKLEESKVAAMMEGLKKAAVEQKIVVPGGEIAELGQMVNGYTWNATAVGIVEKHKLITGKNIQPGDKIIGLISEGFRSNGLSLVRYILKEKLGENWAHQMYDEHKTWGEMTLTPCQIYSSAVLEMHGRYQQPAKLELKGVVNITGGGIPGNLPRILKKTGLGARLNQLPEPAPMMTKLVEMGQVSREEAYRTWNMGVGMILVSNEVDAIAEICQKYDIQSQVIGEITAGGAIEF